MKRLHGRGTGWNRLLALALALTVTACTQKERAPAGERPVIRVMSAMAGGPKPALMSELTRNLSRTMPTFDFRETDNPGAIGTIEALQRGSVDIGLAGADVVYLAYIGALPGAPHASDQLRGILVHRTGAFHVVVRRGSGIRRFRELKGHSIGIGPPLSGTFQFASFVLKSFGIDVDQADVEALPFGVAAARLTEGKVDAFLQLSSYESEAVERAMKAGAYLLPVEGAATGRLRTEYPFVHVVTIPARTYSGQASPVTTLGVDNLLVCRRDLPAQWVYEVTKEVFNVLPTLASLRHPVGGMDANRVAGTPIPLHEGAKRYFREQELFR